jgi:hypothetical protein
MFEKFKEQRRIYRLIKNIKNKLPNPYIGYDSMLYYTYWEFYYKNLTIQLMEHKCYTGCKIPLYGYTVTVNNITIDGWYGLKLQWMLRMLLYKREKQKELNKLKSIK